MNQTDAISDYLRRSAHLLTQVADERAVTIAAIAQAIADCFRAGGKVLLFGNGGSAADADHIAGELAGRFRRDRPALPALALTGSSATLTAIANDYSYAEVFERPVRALANPGDVVIGLSTSGNSPNVLRGLQAARERGARTVGFTSASGGQMPAHADHLLQVPSNDTPLIQQAHLAAAHIICELVEQALFPK